MELVGTSIRDGDQATPGLALWDFYSTRKTSLKKCGFQFVGCFDTETGERIDVLGQHSQYSSFCGDFAHLDPWLDIQVGLERNLGIRTNGIQKNHFFATDSLGPFLVLNPPFCKYLLRLLGLDARLPFEQEAMDAYEARKQELYQPGQVL